MLTYGLIKCDSVPGLPDKEMAAMELGLAHSLSRYKLKFSPDKIDTMIVQVNARIFCVILSTS